MNKLDRMHKMHESQTAKAWRRIAAIECELKKKQRRRVLGKHEFKRRLMWDLGLVNFD